MPDHREHKIQKQIHEPGVFSFSGRWVGLLSSGTWIYIALSGVTLLALGPAIFNDFQYNWDDQWMLLNNPILVHHDWNDITYFFTHFYHNQYSPINQFYYLGIYLWFEFNPYAFHFGSVLLHLFNGILVFALLRRILGWFPQIRKTNMSVFCALVTLVFLVHPLQVESVAWISASKVLLYSFFMLLGLITYIRFLEGIDRSGIKRGLNLFVVFLCYILSIMGKEQAVIMPVNLVLFFIFYHHLHARSWHYLKWLHLLPFFIMAFLYWYWSAQHSIGLLNEYAKYPFGQRLVFGSYSLMIYIFRFLAPVKTYYFYGFPIVPGEPLPVVYYMYVVLILFFIRYLYILWKKKQWLPLFGLLFFVINLLLALHILPIRRDTVTADRYLYLSIVGIGLCGGVFIRRYIQKCEFRFRKMIMGGLIVYFVFCIIHSNIQSRKWENSETIKQEVQQIFQTGNKESDG